MPGGIRGRAVQIGAVRRQALHQRLRSYALGIVVGYLMSATLAFGDGPTPLPMVDTDVVPATAIAPIAEAAPPPTDESATPVETVAAATPNVPAPPQPPTLQIGVPDFFPFASAKM